MDFVMGLCQYGEYEIFHLLSLTDLIMRGVHINDENILKNIDRMFNILTQVNSDHCLGYFF